jgi:AraC-like DNA-binding protein
MKLATYTPRQPLANFVEVLWWCQRDTVSHTKERLLPMGTMELVLDLAEETSGPWICGAHSKSFEIETAEPATIVGVHFKPGGAFPFLGLPAGELHNTRLTLDTLWGRKAGLLRERVFEAATPAAKMRVLEQALIEQATCPLVRHPAVAFALKEFDATAPARMVSDVVEATGLSPRRFIDLFRDEVGLTPKLYRRIRRFQQLLERIQGSQRIDWANIALDCGYYDQAHFIHDFRAFSGLNPTTYLCVRGDHLNHVPLAG